MVSSKTGGIIGKQISTGRNCSIQCCTVGAPIIVAGAFVAQTPSFINVLYEGNGSIATPGPAYEGTIVQININDFKAS